MDGQTTDYDYTISSPISLKAQVSELKSEQFAGCKQFLKHHTKLLNQF